MKNKIILFILIIVLTYSIGGICYVKFIDKKEEKVTNLEVIDKFEYTLKSNANALYKEEFNKLKANLTSEVINEEEYALSVAKLFIIDLYTLNNKMNKYDVGGTDFVYPLNIDNYKLNVQDTLYKYLEDNSNNNRNQALPEVNFIEIMDYEKGTYEYNNVTFDAYTINLKWDYVLDYEYSKSAKVIVIYENSKYYIAEVE